MRISVLKDGIDYRKITKNNLSDFVSKRTVRNRKKILSYLKQNDDQSIVSPRTYRDPVTNKIVVSPIETHEKDGFVWSNVTTYLFEKYNISLNEKFIEFFQ